MQLQSCTGAVRCLCVSCLVVIYRAAANDHCYYWIIFWLLLWSINQVTARTSVRQYFWLILTVLITICPKARLQFASFCLTSSSKPKHVRLTLNQANGLHLLNKGTELFIDYHNCCSSIFADRLINPSEDMYVARSRSLWSQVNQTPNEATCDLKDFLCISISFYKL